MPAIPSIASFTGALVTEGEFKTALSNLHLFLTGLLGTDGTQAGAQAAMGAILGAGSTTKTASYTVDFTDRGKVIACDGSFTVTLPDASAVGSGFAVAVANYGTGTVTVDPFSTQTIDGVSSKPLLANGMLVACAVSGEWLTVGGTPPASTSAAGIVQLSTSTASTSTTLAATSSAVKEAYDLAAGKAAASHTHAYVPTDAGQGVGTFRVAEYAATVGSTYAASVVGASAGTWRCTGMVLMNHSHYIGYSHNVTTFQRIS